MAITLPSLPFNKNALEPYLSAETIDYHYGKHHQAYVDKLNTLIKGTNKENQSLEEIIKSSEGPVFNNAAQVWNHTFYWDGLIHSNRQTQVPQTLLNKINSTFGSLDNFKKQFNEIALNLFGSGWCWLVEKSDGKLEIIGTSNAATPIVQNQKPLLTCDVWEHAYYIDYRNARAKYLENFWNIVNWQFVANNL